MGAPLMNIADNAGLLGALVKEKVAMQDWGYGFNAKTLVYENLLETGIYIYMRVYIDIIHKEKVAMQDWGYGFNTKTLV